MPFAHHNPPITYLWHGRCPPLAPSQAYTNLLKRLVGTVNKQLVSAFSLITKVHRIANSVRCRNANFHSRYLDTRRVFGRTMRTLLFVVS